MLLLMVMQHVAILNLLLLATILLRLASLLLLFFPIIRVHTWNTPFAYWIPSFPRRVASFRLCVPAGSKLWNIGSRLPLLVPGGVGASATRSYLSNATFLITQVYSPSRPVPSPVVVGPAERSRAAKIFLNCFPSTPGATFHRLPEAVADVPSANFQARSRTFL